MPVKIRTAGQFYDSLVKILGTPLWKSGAPQADPHWTFVQIFADDGDLNLNDYHLAIPHLIRLMNANQFARQSVAALTANLAKPDRSADDVATDLFLSVLSRNPTADELKMFRVTSPKSNR